MKQQQKQLCSSCRTFLRLRLRRLLRSTLPPWLRTAVNASAAAPCPPAAHTHTHTQTIGSCLATECRLQQRQGKERDRNSKQWVKRDSLSLCSVCTFSSMEIQIIILNPLYYRRRARVQVNFVYIAATKFMTRKVAKQAALQQRSVSRVW